MCFFIAMCFFYVMYLISGRVLAPGMCALAASTCYTRITLAYAGKTWPMEY